MDTTPTRQGEGSRRRPPSRDRTPNSQVWERFGDAAERIAVGLGRSLNARSRQKALSRLIAAGRIEEDGMRPGLVPGKYVRRSQVTALIADLASIARKAS